jgi:chemotaxis protein methyltransferase CheR
MADRGTLFLSLRDFRRLAELVHLRVGLRFEDRKLYFLANRLRKRMKALGITSVAEYLHMLDHGDPRGREFQELVNLITVNETYFFRDFPQLTSFSSGCLEKIVADKNRTGRDTLRVWSAGCSSGEEPYTVAIILLEMLGEPAQWDISILGSDIDRAELEQAERGVYGPRSLREVPAEYLARYFLPRADGGQEVRPELRRLVRFEHLNLMDDERMRGRRGFDFIFCRNVLMYFGDVSRRKVIDHFYVALNRPGFIFPGSSEHLGGISQAFSVKKISDLLVYGKE